MKNATSPRDKAVSQVAERQMRAWVLSNQSQQRIAEQKTVASVPDLIKPYIVISRETGAHATEIAHLVAKQLSWKIFDRELLDYMAEYYHLSRLALDFVDENAASWFHEMFGTWLEKQLVSQAEYVSHLGHIVLLAAQHESIVFVGRGAHFILPRERGIAVRMIAPKKQRVNRLMQQRECSQHDAEKYVDETDAGRAEFIHRYFHQDPANASLYDLVINLKFMSPECAAELILDRCRQRFPLL